MFKKVLKGIAAVYAISFAAILGVVVLVNVIFYALK